MPIVEKESPLTEQQIRLGSLAKPENGAQIYRAPAAQVLRLRVPHTQAFSAVGVTWREHAKPEAAAMLNVAIRTENAGQWGRWFTSTSEHPMPARQRTRAAAELVWTGAGRGVEVVVTSFGDTFPTDLRIHLVDPGAKASDRRAQLGAVPHAATPSELPVHRRAEWGADESQMTWPAEYADSVRAVTIHHTAGNNNYSPEDVPGILRSIYYYHAVTQGWGDIGYNVLVDKFGRAWEGRAGGINDAGVGAHAGGFNTGTSGVSLIGDYTGTEPSSEALETIAQFIAAKLGAYGVDPRGSVTLTGGPSTKFATQVTISLPTVFGHNATSSTACPGARLEAKFDFLRQRAIDLGHVTLV